MPPQTRYARNGSIHIAYQTMGDAPLDLVLVDQWFSNIQAQWEFEPLARLLERLASFSRLIVFDKRGTGVSDPVSIDALPTLEQWIDDMRVVLEAVGSERTALLSGLGASLMAVLFAATYPERTSALVLVDPYARMGAAPDYPRGRPPGQLLDDLERLGRAWGGPGGLLPFLAPNLLHDRELVERYGRYERQAAGPGAAKAMIGMLFESDVRDVLPTIRVPTLVISRTQGPRVPPEHGRYIADRIPGARFIEIAGSENVIWAGDTDSLVGEIQEFLTGVRHTPEPDRVLATVLFTDIVDSTRLAVDLGDRRWREVLGRHDAIVRATLQKFRGREVKTTGDGVLATFDGPARAVRCAQAVREAVRELQVEIRAGVHTGEIELIGNDVGGIAVHIAARILALAGPNEILASSTVKDLVAGSGITFQDRGLQALRGVPDEWRIMAVVD